MGLPRRSLRDLPFEGCEVPCRRLAWKWPGGPRCVLTPLPALPPHGVGGSQGAQKCAGFWPQKLGPYVRGRLCLTLAEAGSPSSSMTSCPGSGSAFGHCWLEGAADPERPTWEAGCQLSPGLYSQGPLPLCTLLAHRSPAPQTCQLGGPLESGELTARPPGRAER